MNIDGAHVTGHYNWIPAYKDWRLESFEDSLQGASFDADYDCMQEGIRCFPPCGLE